MRKQEAMKESMERWKKERELNADYIAQMKQAKEERKKEIEAQEALLIQMKEEAEAEEAAAAEEEAKIEDKPAEAAPAAKKADAPEEKKNFADQKKASKPSAKNEALEAMNKLIVPFDVSTMDVDQMKKKVEELYDIFTNLINDKINLNKKMVEQDGNIK